MDVRGRIIQAMPLQSGTSAAGRAWKKQEFLLETFDQYPRKVLFTVFGDKVDQLAPSFVDAMQKSMDVTVSFDLESRSFTGRDGVERWSTEVRPWRIADTATVQVPGYDGSAGGFAPAAPVQPQFQQPVAAQFQQPQPVVPQFPAQQAAPVAENPSDDLPF